MMMTKKNNGNLSFEDGEDYFKQQSKKERKLANEVKRRHKFPRSLLVEHTIQEVAEFLKANENSIASRPYLYRVPDAVMFNLFGSTDFTLLFDWSGSLKSTPLRLGVAYYVLFTKEERDSAIQAYAQSKDAFHYVMHKEQQSPALYSVKQEPLDSIHFTKGVSKEPVDSIDLRSSFIPSSMYLFLQNSLFSCIDSVLEKRPFKQESLTPFLDTIVNSGDLVQESEDKVLAIEEDAVVPYKKKRMDFRVLLEGLAYTAKLESQLREAEAQSHAKEVADLRTQIQLRDEAIRLQEKELQLKLSENTFLKEKEYFFQQQQQHQQQKKPRSRPSQPKKSRQPTKNAPINQFVANVTSTDLVLFDQTTTAVATTTNLVETTIIQTQQNEALLEQERAALAYKQQQQKAFEDYDRMVHGSLLVREKMSPGGTTRLFANVAVSVEHMYKLRAVFEQLLDTLNEAKNDAYQVILDDPLFNEYRVFMTPNVPFIPANATEEFQAQMMKLVDQEAFKLESPTNRVNMSNILVHLWFLAKAIELNKEPSRTYNIEILQNRRYNYAPEILRKWYPFLSAGLGTVITEDLKMPARACKKGPGEGKCCCFCEVQFFAVTNGIIKHSHHLKHCDLLANLSNDERVLIQAVMERRLLATQISATVKKADLTHKQLYAIEFASSEFITKYTEKSFLRLATDEEIATERFVLCPFTGDRVRVNMPQLMKMRAKNWDCFTKRIGLLDTATDRKNLDGRPIVGLMDCFNFAAPRQKYNIHLNAMDGLLYKCLVDYEGQHYMTSKRIKSKRPEDQRSFVINPETGFGDDVFFSMPYDQEIANLQPLVFALDNGTTAVNEEEAHAPSNIDWQPLSAQPEEVMPTRLPKVEELDRTEGSPIEVESSSSSIFLHSETYHFDNVQFHFGASSQEDDETPQFSSRIADSNEYCLSLEPVLWTHNQ